MSLEPKCKPDSVIFPSPPPSPPPSCHSQQCASLRGRSTASALEVFKDGVRVDAANKCGRHGGEPSTSRAAKAAKVQVEGEVEVDDALDSPSTQRWGGTTHRVFKLAEWHAPLYAWPWAGRSATAWAAEELERPDTRPVRVCDETEPPGEAWSCAGEYTDSDSEADDSHMVNVRDGVHMCTCVDGVAANMHSTASDGEDYECDGHVPGLSAMLHGMRELTNGRVCIAGSYALHHYLRVHRGVDGWPCWTPGDIDIFYCPHGGELDGEPYYYEIASPPLPHAAAGGRGAAAQPARAPLGALRAGRQGRRRRVRRSIR